ncbi:DUF6161 domain-containing protein [Brevundimonas subvibrioides]|uniref:DUF6161 domain-containing protein n=1 Tax=Brevundimonas subvibrioides (strain ATCC 15264 / DSM 4735 / LMG 14903 / NBRC 16000 / CB 81) TaxID=633149 RepID=D9QGA5_BRESC|nr:DUF6161 domain-containing protein [Brevundimonas subvibrioides]ADL00721.1 conserved hypothetical protein [Brevundimonas subvibrioides ATCC 15264]
MAQTAVLELGPDNGSRSFSTYAGLLRWIVDERAKWVWLEGQSDPGNSINRVLGRFNQLEAQVQRRRDEGIPLTTAIDEIRGYFEPNGDEVYLAGSSAGRQIQLIGEVHGRESAATALSLVRNWMAPSNLSTLDQFKGALGLSLPSTLTGEKSNQALDAERKAFRASARKMVSEGETAEANRAAAVDAELVALRRETMDLRRRLTRRWGQRRRAQRARHEAAISEIKAVTVAYNEFMHLQAPADYWAKKASAHKTAEDAARGRLYVFFPIALVGISLAFAAVGAALLRPGPGPATPVYVVVSAGLATFAGLIFWVGRLLTRLYLSEHHLRKDAEEREVMTTTYLALTRDQAADEKDRHIILSALFRNSSDGIVKEDGGVDPTMAGMVARLGMGR